MASLQSFIAVMLVMGAEGASPTTKKKCGTLFSEKDSKGEQFVLNDFEQFGILPTQYQNNIAGWKQTGSVQVERKCTLKVCRSEGLKEPCSDLIKGHEKPFFELNFTQSAACTCQRDCKCEDIFIPKDTSKNPSFGRFYFKGGCSTCDSEYVKLQSCDPSPEWKPRSIWHSNEIEAVVLRAGCNITVYSEKQYRGVRTLISIPIFKGQLTVFSYNVSCNDADFVKPPVQPRKKSYPQKIVFPSSKEEFRQVLSSDPLLSAHPGYQIAAQSSEIGRSHQNAYVIIIGTHDPSVSGFPQCRPGKKEEIGECRIPVLLDYLGIEAKLVVITVPVVDTYRPSLEIVKDYKALEKYLTSHDELQTVTPNAIIVYHKLAYNNFTDTENSTAPINNRILTLESQRSRLVDERFSNVLFLFHYSKAEKNITDIGELVKSYETKMDKNYKLPKPFASCVKSTIQPKEATIVNGYTRMEHGELWPRNLELLLGNMCGDGKDPLGKAIFEAAFQDNQTLPNSIKQFSDTSVDDDNLKPEIDPLCKVQATNFLGRVFG